MKGVKNMLSYDAEKAARVWERVHAGAETIPQGQDLPALIATEWTAAAIYLRLSRHFQGKDAATLRRISEEEKAHGACLTGIYTLLTGAKAGIAAPAARHETIPAVLRRCYQQEIRSVAEYEKRSNDPEYGPVFAKLAAQEKEHCRIVLELLGKVKDPV